MNFKTSALALAVAGTIATPMAAQADLYASARIGVHSVDHDDVSELAVGGVASRFGMRSETDLGNGMTGFGRYEFSVGTEGGSTNVGRRHAYVGLKGDFGSVTLGQTYHTFYNHVSGPLDIPWVGSLFALVSTTGRTAEALTYAGGTDGVTFGVTLYMEDDDDPDLEGMDAWEVGATFGIADMMLGVGAKGADGGAGDDPEDVIGLTLHGISFGDVSMGVSYQMQDDDSSIGLHADIGNIYFHYEMLDCDADSVSGNCNGYSDDGGEYAVSFDQDTSPSLIVLGYNQSLGRNTLVYYEAHVLDADTDNSDDDTTGLYATLKYDIE